MKTIGTTLAAAVAATMLTGGVYAADLPSAPQLAAPQKVTASWTGAYGGIGTGFSSVDLSKDIGGVSIQAQDWNVMGRVGYDYQTPFGVLGIFGDITALVNGGDAKAVYSLNARYGIPAGNLMPYITGGAAWQGFSTDSYTPTGFKAGAGMEFRWTDHLSISPEIDANWASDKLGSTGLDSTIWSGELLILYRF